MLIEDEVIEDVDEAELRKPARRPVKRTDPGQDQFVGSAQLVRVRGPKAVGPDLAQHVVDGPEIAHPVIHDCDHDGPLR
jgi:hypothetical protein